MNSEGLFFFFTFSVSETGLCLTIDSNLDLVNEEDCCLQT